ncbi:MAG: mannose-6-phosphate isomerase, class I [Spirochaetales bacterium]|nr:mannose-6-phosphate isomerase, class I [Spirochaetales bacterium]
MAIFKTSNTIQKYAWGSALLIPEYLDFENPEKEPMAELWMGAHPKAPSNIILSNGEKKRVDFYLNENPEKTLGAETVKKIGNNLPYLFKVLAADSPLSIQAHPNLNQAAEGFKRENDEGVPLTAFNRNYKDSNHKPELICALSSFKAMRGFRSLSQIEEDFSKIAIPELKNSIEELKNNNSAVLENFFRTLMNLKDEQRKNLIENALSLCERDGFSGLQKEWMKRFSEIYPDDIGIISPLYLNIVTLNPGEAMYLSSGELHAYLEGIGIEIMANSDNVLRGGLTPKYIDVKELLSVLNFHSVEPEILKPEAVNKYESVYKTEAKEFILSKIKLDKESYKLAESSNISKLPSMFICLEGEVELNDMSEEGSVVTLKKGEAAFADFSANLYIEGAGLLYRAAVPV